MQAVLRQRPVVVLGVIASSFVLGASAGALFQPTKWLHAEERLQAFPNADSPPSLVRILAHPERFNKKRVSVKGYVRARFEDFGIYLSEDDARYGITVNGFWIQSIEGVDLKKFDGKFVGLEGEFDMNSRGHLSLWQGTFSKIDRIAELKKTE